MARMFVLCPHCQFLVALDPVSGQPPERCPRCDELLQPATIATPEPVIDLAQPEPLSVADVPLTVAEPDHATAVDVTSPIPEPETQAAAAPSSPVTAKPSPSFARSSAELSRHRWRMPASILGLTALLLLQMLLADRTQLAADARWRPALSTLCGVMHCTLPTWREPAAFTMLARNVRPDPHRPGVLHVTARFRNDARWAQAWPGLLLTLSDVDGRVAGARLFMAHDYLAIAPTQNGLASGQSATIAMNILEPAPQVVAFTFDFR